MNFMDRLASEVDFVYLPTVRIINAAINRTTRSIPVSNVLLYADTSALQAIKQVSKMFVVK